MTMTTDLLTSPVNLTAPQPRVLGQGRGFDIVRILLGLILLFAAVLKLHQLLTNPILPHRAWGTLQVQGEWLFGLVLLSGRCKRQLRLLAILCFLVFAAVSFYSALRGETSCGCFGQLKVNPWITTAFDLSAVLALLLLRPGPEAPAIHPILRRVGAVALLTATPALGLVHVFAPAPAQLDMDGTIKGTSRVVVLEPEKWVGSLLPLLTHIDVAERIKTGTWVLVFYHHDCPNCQKTVEELAASGNPSDSADDTPVAMIELPPFGNLQEEYAEAGFDWLWGRVVGQKKWFMVTPSFLWLEDGKVVKVRNPLETRHKESP